MSVISQNFYHILSGVVGKGQLLRLVAGRLTDYECPCLLLRQIATMLGSITLSEKPPVVRNRSLDKPLLAV